jgi:hypothetical protein
MKTCNHPKEPNNLIDGKCGTCAMVKQWRGIKDKLLRPHALGIAKAFESGELIYDTKGKSLLDWETHFNKK